MNLCPSCNNIMHERNSHNGVYYSCDVCNYQAWNYNLLKREGFEPKPLRDILNRVKNRQDNFHGNCVSCQNAYIGVDYKLQGLPIKVYVCSSCKVIVLHRSHLEYLPKITIIPKQEELKLSTNTIEAMKQVDEAILKNERKWQRYDKVSKVSSVKFMIMMMVVFFSLIAALSLTAFFANSAFTAGIIIVFFLFVFTFFAYKIMFKKQTATEIFRALFGKKL